MNHKKLFEKANIDSKQIRESLKKHRHSRHKSSVHDKYESLIKGTREYKNMLINNGSTRKSNPPTADKMYGNYIRKPKRESNSDAKAASNLRTTIMRRIMTEQELEPSNLNSSMYERTSGFTRKMESRRDANNSLNLHARDYSFELYKKMKDPKEKDRRREREIENIREKSRSISASLDRKALDISDDKINVGRLLGFNRDFDR